MNKIRASAALSRFTVIDLTRARAGPTCVRQLADWGADVIKVEMPASAGEPQDFANRADSDFQNLHRNKRSLTLNLKTAEGVAVLKRLVEGDPACEAVEQRLRERPAITVPAISLNGASDGVMPASLSERHHRFFTGPYARRVLPGVGHNVPQEAPQVFADAVLELVEGRLQDDDRHRIPGADSPV